MTAAWAGRGEAVWNKAGPVAGTLAEVYLGSRGIRLAPGPETLRFLASADHPKLKHQQFPALIARVNGGPEASHQVTYLAPDGKGKAALDRGEQRRTFGAYKGGAVHLGDYRPGEPLLIGEGVETVLTAMEATGLSGWASLGASNLPNIQWPSGAEIIILAENDTANRKAIDRACPKLIERGLMVKVASPPIGCSDFNDCVRHGIDRGSGLIIAKMAIDSAQPWTPPKGKNDDPEDGNFSLTATGLHLRKNKKWNWLAQPFEVLGMARDGESAHWGCLLRFVNADGVTCDEVVETSLLHRDLGAALEPLLSRGMAIKCTLPARQAFAEYLTATLVPDRVTTAHRVGWHEVDGRRVFVLPNEIIGAGASEHIILAARGADALYTRRGDLADWQERVGNPAGHHRMARFAISTALAGPLLDVAGCESGLFHYYARSSEGKTTCLRCASSVWGSGADGGYLRAWRATSNGLEALLATINDTFLPLDEIGQADQREIGPIIYMITGSVGKARMGRDGATLRPAHKWRVSGLSSGETPIATRLNEDARSGRRAHAGQLVRALDIAAQQTSGVFDHYEDFEPAEFADEMRLATATFYGTVGPAFVRALVERRIDGDHVRRRIAAVAEAMLKEVIGAHGQAARAAERFALVAAAASLAIEFGLLDWPANKPREDAIALFKAWIETRGGGEAAEVRQIIGQIRRFLELYGDARFDDLDPPPASLYENERRPVANRAGFRQGKGDARRWLVLPQVWRDEICAGLDPGDAAKLLIERGMMEKGDGRHYTRNVRLPGSTSTQRFYVLTPQVFEGWGER